MQRCAVEQDRSPRTARGFIPIGGARSLVAKDDHQLVGCQGLVGAAGGQGLGDEVHWLHENRGLRFALCAPARARCAGVARTSSAGARCATSCTDSRPSSSVTPSTSTGCSTVATCRPPGLLRRHRAPHRPCRRQPRRRPGPRPLPVPIVILPSGDRRARADRRLHGWARDQARAAAHRGGRSRRWCDAVAPLQRNARRGARAFLTNLLMVRNTRWRRRR
jgi:hypothetical protein